METYHGHVRTPADAIILFEACRIGLLPRVQRRLSEKERQSIKSGSVFVWDEREAGMRRWTDGKSWSASRVSGSFLTYREMEGKRGGSGFDKNANRDGVQGQDGDSDGGPDGYRYKPDGLMKQSFSITTNNGQHLHLISYFSRSSSAANSLMQPTNDPTLRHIRPEKGMYPESTVHEQSSIPPVTRGPMGSPGYTHSPHHPSPYSRAYGAYPPSWAPPSPMHTPPPHPYPPYYGHPSQHAQYPQHSPMNMHYPQPHGYAQPPPPTAFDRAPPPLNGSGLPPPPPPQYSSAPPSYPHGYGHGYSSGYGAYPPHPAQHHPAQSHPAQPHPAQSHPAQSHPAQSHPAQAHPVQHHPPYPPPPPSSHAPSYDGRASIISSESARRDDRQDSHQSMKPEAESAPAPAPAPAPPVVQPPNDPPAPPPPAPATSGQTIPSISSMLNGGAQPPPRPSSRSPPRALQDIPSHKLGFEANRDVHVLRNLDKTTFKGY